MGRARFVSIVFCVFMATDPWGLRAPPEIGRQGHAHACGARSRRRRKDAEEATDSVNR